EARLWNEVFDFAEDAVGVPKGTIRATVLIETLPAAFQMEEILYELREHSYGLNAGRWDYIFSLIKCFRDRPEFVLPDRNDGAAPRDGRRGGWHRGGATATLPRRACATAGPSASCTSRSGSAAAALRGSTT